MCVEPLKIELASNEEYHRSHGIEIGVQPISWLGIAVLLIFSIELLIILEARLRMDKFKPLLFKLSAFGEHRWQLDRHQFRRRCNGMPIDKSYSFDTHFLPAILTNFLVSLGVWYVQFEIPGWHA